MKYRSHRYPTQFPVQVRTAFGRQNARVVDVNAGGARLAGLRDLQRGDKIQLDVLSQKVSAVVLWANAGNIGVCFRPQLTGRLLDTLQYSAKQRTGSHRQTVGFHHVNY